MPPSRPRARREETVVKMINQNHYIPGLDKTKKVDSRVWHIYNVHKERKLDQWRAKCEEMQSSESGGCLIFQPSRTLDNTVEIDDSVESGCSKIKIYYKFLHKNRTIYMPVPVHHIFMYSSYLETEENILSIPPSCNRVNVFSGVMLFYSFYEARSTTTLKKNVSV